MSLGSYFSQIKETEDERLFFILPTGASTNAVEIHTIAGSGSADVFREVSTSSGSPYEIDTFNPSNIRTNIADLRGASWADDGNLLFVVDDTRIRKYSTQRPYDITLLSNTTNTEYGRPNKQSVLFNNDGTKIYELSENVIREASLPAPYDITATNRLTQSKRVDTDIGDLYGIQWSSSGSQLFTGDRSAGELIQQTALTPFDINTLQSPTRVNDEVTTSYGFTWKPDGTRLWVVDYDSSRVAQFDVAPPFDLTGKVLDQRINTIGGGTMGIVWNDDGTRVIELDYGSHRLREGTVATPYDLSTRTSTGITRSMADPQDGQFTPDGTQLLVSRYNSDNVYIWNFGTPYDLSTAYLVDTINVDGSSGGLTWNDTYSEITVGGEASGEQLTTYTTSDTNHIKSLFTKEFALEDSSSTGLAWNDDGSLLYEIGAGENKIYEYALSTPFDISTAQLSTSIDTQDNNSTGLAWKPDGTKLYEVGRDGSLVYQYSLNNPYDISSASFDVSSSTDGEDPQDILWEDTGNILFEINEAGIEQLRAEYDQRFPVDSFNGEFYSQKNKYMLDSTMRLVIKNKSNTENAYIVTGMEISE